MSGHSKWATTKHKKAAIDAKRSALFSKHSRNITVAARTGGDPNPDNNASLAAAVARARMVSMPNAKIKAAIDKAFGSGADAAVGLAVYVAGSHESFVEQMNEKAKELGLSDGAHFTNCVGLYNEAHKCTVYDMALIMKAAMDDPLCREVLNARTYETAPTEYHPQGQVLSNWFLRRIEDRDNGGIQVIGAKTGYVVQSGSCAVSSGEDGDGRCYIVATGDAAGSWNCIYDHTLLYHDYCAKTDGAV